ncbi:MAG: oligosaccharide flippase family protein [Acidobacteria bacterium]|nr:oligosaccharide flippase family protein [Acidobacteriota bacterium]
MLKKEVKSITKQSAAYSLGDFINYFINFLLFPVYIKMLTPVEYGILMLVTLFGTLMRMLLRLGINDGYMRLYYDYKTDKEKKELLGTSIYGLLIINTVILLPLYLVIDWVAKQFLYDPELAGTDLTHLIGMYTPLFTVMLLASGVRSFLNIPFTLLRVEERAKTFAFISIVRFFTNMGLKVLFVVFFKWNIHGIVMVDLITSLFFTTVFLPIFWKKVSLRFNFKMFKEMMAFGLPKVPHNMAHHLLNQADRYLLSRFASLSSLGIYGVGYTVGMALKFFSYAFNMTWGPYSYKIYEEEDAPVRISKISTYNLALQVISALLISVFARELFEVFNAILDISPKWFEALPVVPFIAFAYVFQAAYFMTNIGISISKKTYYYPIVTISSLAVNIIFNIILIPIWGIKGAAVTAIISYAAMAWLALIFGNKFYRVPWEWKRIGILFCASVGIVLAVQILNPFGFWLRMIFKIVFILLFPLILILTDFFNKNEKNYFNEIIKKYKNKYHKK